MTARYLTISMVALAVFSTAAVAGAAEDLSFAIGRCSAQPDANARLACYDQLAVRVKAGASLVQAAPPVAAPQPPATQPPATPQPAPPPPVAPPASATQVAETPPPAKKEDGGSWYNPASWLGSSAKVQSSNPADFGAEALPAVKQAAMDDKAPVEELTAKVASTVYNSLGRFTVTLDNGQVWKQLDSDSGTVRFSSKGGEVVTISRGVVGSYNLVAEGHTSLFKVKRIK